MEEHDMVEPPKDFEDIIKRVQAKQKTNRYGAVKHIWDRMCGPSTQQPTQSIDDMVANQQKIKEVSSGPMGRTFEDFTAGALNALQMRNITQALGDGGGKSSMDDKFDVQGPNNSPVMFSLFGNNLTACIVFQQFPQLLLCIA
ncbi:hypothetical protein ES703_125592 [subsurface metagenome]